ncbi:MAG TPA: LegC family aminotransferase [Lentisphaeria bacterium]|nr:MAG: aminotransferase DegT [Lentisphaerae bacterium GWF2_38_69]HBM15416.1 LegC family aminotransferase [Lentisphaeria bacterium]
MYKNITDFIKEIYSNRLPVPLHEPCFKGNEKKYLQECIDSTFVSYVGPFVSRFEQMICDYTGSKFAVAMANGTLALHLALVASGVRRDDEVLTQAMTFVATANAISQAGAQNIFLDSDLETLGMSPEKLSAFLKEETIIKKDGYAYNKKTGRRISACVPVHIFGHPLKIADIVKICSEYNIKVIEDAAESLGSWYRNKHTGTFGAAGILSFNGNKTITTGGGGMLVTDDADLAMRAKHLSTTAKIPHAWEFRHDEIGYNYRMPNVNAAIGCAQMENLEIFITQKRALADKYAEFFAKDGIEFFKEPEDCRSNYWLNTIILNNRAERDSFLEYANDQQVMARPGWCLMPNLPMYKNNECGNLSNAETLESKLVNIPSSVIC